MEDSAGAVIDAVLDNPNGFRGVELGLAVVGAVAISYSAFKLVTKARKTMDGVKNMGDDVLAGMEEMENDPKFQRVRKEFVKEYVKGDE